MTRIELTALCTREEYLRFCASMRGKPRVGLMAAGWLCVLLAAGFAAVGAIDMTTALLPLLGGLFIALFEPLFLPIYCKGEAGRLYDEGDSLSQAVAVVLEGDTLTLRSAHVCGSLPLSSLTKTIKTDEMLALVFGAEVTVLLPLRAFTGDQLSVFLRAAADRKMEQ